MSSQETEEQYDLLNMNLYGVVEWIVFNSILLTFGCCCFMLGICCYRWRIRNHILTDGDIHDRDDDQTKVTFRGTIRRLTNMMPNPTAMGTNSSTLDHSQSNQHLDKSAFGKQQNTTTSANGKVSYNTLDVHPRLKPPAVSMTESQIRGIVGVSMTKEQIRQIGDVSKLPTSRRGKVRFTRKEGNHVNNNRMKNVQQKMDKFVAAPTTAF